MSNLVPIEIIAGKILLIRGQKVMIDRELVTSCDRLALLRHPVFPIVGSCHGV